MKNLNIFQVGQSIGIEVKKIDNQPLVNNQRKVIEKFFLTEEVREEIRLLSIPKAS
jgi:hypothetical protein